MHHGEGQAKRQLRPTGWVVGFTLIEMLVVIAIIGILATISLPAIKGMSKSNAITAANRQLLDDLGYARQRAIADHTSVYVVFIPPTVYQIDPSLLLTADQPMLSNLWGGQYTTYALISLRSAGDQPGVSSTRYLTGWRSLPNGVFISTNKFGGFVQGLRLFASDANHVFPFPSATSTFYAKLPYIGFDYLGQLESKVNEDIPLTRGSILYQVANGGFLPQPGDVQETPPNNTVTLSNNVHIDWVTGRTRIQRQEVQ